MEKEDKDLYDTVMRIEREDNLNTDELKEKYELKDDNVISRLISLRNTIKTKRDKSMSYDELILFLNFAMNYDDMQIWLIKNELQGVQLTLNDELEKFFELNTDDDILRSYDIGQNCDQNNIDSIKTLKKRR